MNKRRPDWLRHDPPKRMPIRAFHRERRDYVGEIMAKLGITRNVPAPEPEIAEPPLTELSAAELKQKVKDAGKSPRNMSKEAMIAVLNSISDPPVPASETITVE